MTSGQMVETIVKIRDKFEAAFKNLEEAHYAYVAAKDSEEDDPGDLAYMDGPIADCEEALQAWKIWYEAQEEKREARQALEKAERQAKENADQDVKEAAEKTDRETKEAAEKEENPRI